MTGHFQKHFNSSLPYSVYPADNVRELEQRAVSELGLSLYQLMERAGQAAFHRARQFYPTTRRWLVLCGHGNNGGDGYVVARLARQLGIQVTLVAVEHNGPLPPEAQQARDAWIRAGGEIQSVSTEFAGDIELIIDGLLGIGLRAAPREPYASLIQAANQHPAPILSLDIPSGLNADTGHADGAVIQAQHTQTFITCKPGQLTGYARDVVGTLHCDELGLSHWLKKQNAPIARLDASLLNTWLHPRRPCSHKGDNGRLVLIGGDHGMAGAIRMAGEAALRSGAGLVRVLTHIEHIAPLLTSCPEMMVQALTKASLEAALDWADVIVIGPGLGQTEWARQAVQQLQRFDKPMLWDADALNLLAQSPSVNQHRILTPHPGEAARLLNCSVAEIELDRIKAVKKLQQKYGGVVVLKGAGTLIASEKKMSVADVGNPGMGTGGMGDVLSGIIGGLLAQKLPLYDAACSGCVVHGAAADEIAEEFGERGMLATDLFAVIRHYVNPKTA